MKNSIRDKGAARDSYHHGNLRSDLIDHGVQLLAEVGVGGFSMREVARRAGVTVAAPRPHFGHAKGLLTAIAACGFEALAARQIREMARSDDPIRGVILLCETYVLMAQTHPGYAAIMFRWDLLDRTDATYSKAAGNALGNLTDAVAEALPPDANRDIIDHTAKTLWATMQGFVTLSLTEGDQASSRVEFAVKSVLFGAVAIVEKG